MGKEMGQKSTIRKIKMEHKTCHARDDLFSLFPVF